MPQRWSSIRDDSLMKSQFIDFNMARRFQTWAAFLEASVPLVLYQHTYEGIKKELQTDMQYFFLFPPSIPQIMQLKPAWTKMFRAPLPFLSKFTIPCVHIILLKELLEDGLLGGNKEKAPFSCTLRTESRVQIPLLSLVHWVILCLSFPSMTIILLTSAESCKFSVNLCIKCEATDLLKIFYTGAAEWRSINCHFSPNGSQYPISSRNTFII